jgi:hypothetical protein
MKKVFVKLLIAIAIGLAVGQVIGFFTKYEVYTIPHENMEVTKQRYDEGMRNQQNRDIYRLEHRFNKRNFIFSWSIISSLLIVLLLIPELKDHKKT